MAAVHIGARGRVEEVVDAGELRLPVPRAACWGQPHLLPPPPSADEVWIANHPVLLLGYLMQVWRRGACVPPSAAASPQASLHSPLQPLRNRAANSHTERAIQSASLPAAALPSQYVPWLGMLALKRVGPARARALRDGKSGYDMAALLRDGSGDGTSHQSDAAAAEAAGAGS